MSRHHDENDQLVDEGDVVGGGHLGVRWLAEQHNHHDAGKQVDGGHDAPRIVKRRQHCFGDGLIVLFGHEEVLHRRRSKRRSKRSTKC